MSEVLRKVWRCDRPLCGHEWLTKSPVPPKRCSRCKSPNWNTDLRFTAAELSASIDALVAPKVSQAAPTVHESAGKSSPTVHDASESHSLTYTSFDDW